MVHPDRVQAVAQATLQASRAMSEFAKVSGRILRGNSSKKDATRVNRARNQAREESTQMVRERSPGSEECFEDEDIAKDQDSKEEPRPSVLKSNCGLWRRSTLRLLSRGVNSFGDKFRDAQLAVIRENTDLLDQLEEFISGQPTTDACCALIINTFGKKSLMEARINLARTALKMCDHDSFIRLLWGLIAADGKSASAVKWAAIVDLTYSLSTVCEWKVLALVMATTPVDDVLDALIHLRLIVATQDFKMLQTSELLYALQAIKSTEAKVLLILKMESNPIEMAVLCEVLELLRQADRQLQQLSLLSFQEWAAIAHRQKWMLADAKDFGPAAYYLGVLYRAGLTAEERRMREVLQQWTHSPLLFGQFVHQIVSRDLYADDAFCTRLLAVAKKEQLCEANSLLSQSERSLRDVVLLVQGLTDEDDDAKTIRREAIQKIVQAVDASDHAKLLAIFDNALQQTTGKRLRAVQKFVVMAALESSQHLLQQVATGEGKSFIIAAVAAIRCMLDKTTTVDVISSSSVLAERDATQLRELYKNLGLTVAHNCHECCESREISYKADIVYGDMAHFQRDYLLHTFYRKNIRGSRQLQNVIVDEVDSMTLDSGNHVLYLSHVVPSLKLLDSLFAFIQREVYATFDGELETEEIRHHVLRDIYGCLTMKDLEIIDNLHARQVFDVLRNYGYIDKEGFILVKEIWNPSELKQKLDSVGDPILTPVIIDTLRMEMERDTEISLPSHLRDFVRLHISSFIDNCKRARVMRPNVEYVVDANPSDPASSEVILMIDTGADLAPTQWAGGLDQFLQMKHACRVTPMSLKAVFISNVRFLRNYARLDGFSGTLGSFEESRTLAEIYRVDLIRVPTHQPRQMVVYVPSLSETATDWIQDVYNGVNTEVNKSRSVLVICETIHQLKQLHVGLSSSNASRRNISLQMDVAIDNIILYIRQHETLDCGECGLETGRLILSTNLAGRGTAILLSEALAKNGGLHVVIAFVPINKRIEEQAMGRAARCGAPGSGQIIALVRPTTGDIAPSYLDFLLRRDNAEMVRIKALRHLFEFRIAVEEGALERLIYQIGHILFREDSSEERMPEAEDVIYKALLDEWTLWLDAKDEEIKKCVDQRDPSAKELIIKSVDEFLLSHSVEKKTVYAQKSVVKATKTLFSSIRKVITGNFDEILSSGEPSTMEVFIVPNWIQDTEWLLKLGIIQARHKGGRSDAERTFHRVAEAGDVHSPYALYYLACLKMACFENSREQQSSLHLKAESGFEPNVDEATALLARARVGFIAQLEQRRAEVRSIRQRAQSGSGPECGLQLQLRELETSVKQIIANIDWLMREPMTAASFYSLIADKQRQEQLVESLKSVDVIDDPSLEIKEVMLPADAHQELFDELCNMEIISPPSIVSDNCHLEQGLIDQTRSVARRLKDEMLIQLVPAPNIAFPGLAKYLQTLDNNRWFESELELSLQWLSMETCRTLIETGRVDDVKCASIKHVTVAYSALWNDLVEEANQRSSGEENGREEEDSLEKIVMAFIDVKMNDLFINPIVNFFRCIISEHSAFHPHKSLLDDDIAKDARQLSKGKSNTWLESLQRRDLIAKAYSKIARLSLDLQTDASLCREQARNIIHLTLMCLHHDIPVPFETRFTILCVFLGLIECLITIKIASERRMKLIRIVYCNRWRDRRTASSYSPRFFAPN